MRGTYAVSQACIPHLKARHNPHILTLSPPIRLAPTWLKPTAYMMAEYGMSLCALAIVEELRGETPDHRATTATTPHRNGVSPVAEQVPVRPRCVPNGFGECVWPT